MKEILELINQMSPYILLGFFLAGIMHAFIPNNLYQKHLGGHSFRSVIKATLLGIPLPLCSCGVIPTAMSLRKEGASKSATIAFLISTPQTGVDSIIATYSLMGLPFAILRPIAALFTALTGGFLATKFDDEKAENSKSAIANNISIEPKRNFRLKIVAALKYAFIDMMQDIGKWLIMGLVIAGLITVFVPESFFELFAHNSLLSMLFVLLIAIPMYLCATGSIPIAVALMLKGLSPGTALVLLMAGPAVNTASMLVIGKVMGRRTLLIYLFSIISGAIAFGTAIDYLLPAEWFSDHLSAIKEHSHSETPYFNIGCSILLAALLINALIKRYFHKDKCKCCNGEECACTAESTHETIFIIEGMACNHCKANVEKALKGIEGVEDAVADLTTGETSIKGSFDHEEAVRAIESLGFTIEEKI